MVAALLIQEAEVPDWDKGLPVDILAQVAAGRDVLRDMRSVSTTWQEGFDSSVRKIRISERGPLLPADGSFQSRFLQLTSLHVEYCKISRPGLAALVGLRKLTTLSLKPPLFDSRSQRRRRRITPELPLVGTEDLQPLQEMMQLESLDLSGCCMVEDDGLANLRGMSLTFLSLNYCRELGSAALEHLRGMPLTKLDLGFCGKITDEGLGCLRGMPLSDLNLGGCKELTGVGLENLVGLPLNKLNLGGCRALKDDDLRFLVGLPLLKLWLNGCEELSGDGLVHLKGLPLKDLNLDGCEGLGGESLVHLIGLRLDVLHLEQEINPRSIQDFLRTEGLSLKKLYVGGVCGALMIFYGDFTLGTRCFGTNTVVCVKSFGSESEW